MAYAVIWNENGLPPEIATTLYRIAQDALTTVVKHARARRVSILLTRKNGQMIIVIEDDGQGFDPSLGSEGLGLDSIRERAALAGGRLRVESSPGAGTTLAIEVPLP